MHNIVVLIPTSFILYVLQKNIVLFRIRSLKEEWVKLPLQGIKVHLWGVHKPRNFNAEKTGKMLVECMLSGDFPLTMKIQVIISSWNI